MCAVEGCERDSVSRGWCHMHYVRWRRSGDPLVTVGRPRRPAPADERFFARVVAGPGCCWIWTGPLSGPYASFSVGRRSVLGHRWVWEFTNSPIPEGLTVDHLCRVKRCVNPSHMEIVTQRVNGERSDSAAALNSRKTECVNGHPFDAANTYTPPGGARRVCRACALRRTREWQARKVST